MQSIKVSYKSSREFSIFEKKNPECNLLLDLQWGHLDQPSRLF